MPIPRKPLTDKQLAANRANAAQSTGPRSPEGKSRSAQNSRKHGFTASTFAVVRLEELDEVARLREDLIAVYQPVNSQELFAVERIRPRPAGPPLPRTPPHRLGHHLPQ